MRKVIVCSLIFILLSVTTALATPKIILFSFKGEIEDTSFASELMKQIGSELNKTKGLIIQLEDYTIRNALSKERDINEKNKTPEQMDKDNREAIAKAATRNAADYALYGSIEALGDKIIIIVSILDVENYKLVAGSYKEIINDKDIMKREARNIIPEIAKEISVQMKDTLARKEEQEKLLVPVFEKEDIDISVENLDLLSLMMSIDIFKTRKYSVFPHNSSRIVVDDTVKWQNQEMEELGVFDKNMKFAENLKMDYTLLGTVNLENFNYTTEGTIFDINKENPMYHGEQYKSIGENTIAIPNISEEITGIAEEKRVREQEEREQQKRALIARQREQELLKQAEVKRESYDSARNRMLIDRRARTQTTSLWLHGISALPYAAGFTCLGVGLAFGNIGLALGGYFSFCAVGLTLNILAITIDSWYPYKPVENFALAPSINYNQDGKSSYGVAFAYRF